MKTYLNTNDLIDGAAIAFSLVSFFSYSISKCSVLLNAEYLRLICVYLRIKYKPISKKKFSLYFTRKYNNIL